MSITETTRCTSCNAEIQFRYTPSGKRMPLDVEPLQAWKQGAYVLDGRYGCLPAALMEPGRPAFMNHFATCPTVHLHKKGADR